MQSFAPPIHDCSGPDRQDGVHERNWSITDEAAKGPSSGGRVCRSGATQGQMRILVGDRTTRNRWPHINGAYAEPVLNILQRPSLPRQNVLWQRQSAKSSSFVILCRASNLPITISFVLTQLGSPASELGQSCVPRLRPAAASWPFGSHACRFIQRTVSCPSHPNHLQRLPWLTGIGSGCRACFAVPLNWGTI